MKKLISISMTLALICAFTSCGNTETSSEPSKSDKPLVTEAVTEVPTEPETPNVDPDIPPESNDTPDSESSESAGSPSVSIESPAKALYADFQAIMAEGSAKTTADIADKLIHADYIPFMGATMETSEGWINGFDEEIKGFKSATFFGPMIGTIPFAGYIFELDSNADTAAFIETLNTKSNLAWNVCTQADERICEAEGNIVFFVMAPAAFEE